MVCMRCSHTLGHSWGKTTLDSPHFDHSSFSSKTFCLTLRDGMVWKGTNKVLTSLQFSFLFLLNRSQFVFTIIVQPIESLSKLCHKKSCCFFSLGHQIVSLTNIFIELAIGLTCFQIDFFVLWHHVETTLI